MAEAITLADFLLPDLERLPAQLAAGIEGTPELSSLKTLLTMRLSSVQWASLLQTASTRVRDLLRVPICTILERAWTQAREVREALEKTRQSPDATEVVALMDHRIESEHKPYLDFYQNGQRIGRITFPVSAELDLRGLLLEIAMGKIQKISSGEIRIKGTVKVGAITLVEKEFEPVRILGEIRFESAQPQPEGDNI